MAVRCVYTIQMITDGTSPPPGSCRGPMERAVARRDAEAKSLCGVSKIAYAVDGSATTMACGDCVPGETFREDGVCSLGQFCTDNATCADVVTSTLWNLSCAFELGAHSSLGVCGPGLRCISGRCVECLPGIDRIPGTLACSRDGRYVLSRPPMSTPGVDQCAHGPWPSWNDTFSSALLESPATLSAFFTLCVAVLVLEICRSVRSLWLSQWAPYTPTPQSPAAVGDLTQDTPPPIENEFLFPAAPIGDATTSPLESTRSSGIPFAPVPVERDHMIPLRYRSPGTRPHRALDELPRPSSASLEEQRMTPSTREGVATESPPRRNLRAVARRPFV